MFTFLTLLCVFEMLDACPFCVLLNKKGVTVHFLQRLSFICVVLIIGEVGAWGCFGVK